MLLLFVECKWEYNCRRKLYRSIETNSETYRRSHRMRNVFFQLCLPGRVDGAHSPHSHHPTREFSIEI